MKKRITLILLAIPVVLVNCETKKAATAQPPATISSVTSCYALTMNGDTVWLTVRQTGREVTGKLRYRLAGKDRKEGTLRGTMHGDTLRADYMFHAEGIESVREVAFLARNGGYLEGFGPVDEKNGKLRFTPNTQQTFGGDHLLKKADCNE